MKIIALFLTITLSYSILADDYSKYLEMSAGISNVSYAETETSVEDPTNTKAEPQSGTVSIISMDIKYRLFPSDKTDYFIRFTAPLTSTSGDVYFSTAGGINFYFDGGVTKTHFNQDGSFIKITPKLRYYAGAELGFGYLVFTTTEVRRNDVLFNIGGHAGVQYTYNDRWTLRGSAHFARGAGSNTNTTAIQVFGGVGYSF